MNMRNQKLIYLVVGIQSSEFLPVDPTIIQFEMSSSETRLYSSMALN